MNHKLNLRTIVPLATVAVGVLAPVKMVLAATSPGFAPDADINKHSVVIETAEDDHGASHEAAAEGGHGAAVVDDHGATHEAAAEGGHGAAVVDDHGATSKATTEGGHGASSISGTPLSPRAQQIEFFTFLGAIGLAIIIPELLYRPKKIAQNFLELENSVGEFPQDVSSGSEDARKNKSEQNTSLSTVEAHTPQTQLVELGQLISETVEEQTASISRENTDREFPQDVFSNSEQTQEYNFEPDLPLVEADTSQVQLVEFDRVTSEEVEKQTASISQEIKAEKQIISTSEDIPNLKIIPRDIEPYTIPNRGQSQFDIEGQMEIDNWSQPGRKAA